MLSFRYLSLTHTQVLAPTLITYRVSTGEAWTRNTTEQSSYRLPASVVTSGGGSRTALGPGGDDIILKSRDGGLESKPVHLYREDSEGGV